MITAEDLVDFMPNILNRNLPSIGTGKNNGDVGNMAEREILYKLLFDMKRAFWTK